MNIPKRIYLQTVDNYITGYWYRSKIKDSDLEYVLVEKGKPPESESEIARILRIICDENNVSVEDVKSKNKEKRLMPARREYCYFAYQLNGIAIKTMGEEINRTHCNVLYHKNVVLSWLEIPAYNLKEKLEGIEKRLKI